VKLKNSLCKKLEKARQLIEHKDEALERVRRLLHTPMEVQASKCIMIIDHAIALTIHDMPDNPTPEERT